MPGTRRVAWLVGVALAAVFPAAATAATPAAEVEEVVVTGRLEETLPLTLGRYGARVETLDGETLRKGGFIDVGQALQYAVPGLSLTPQAGPFSYNIDSLQGSRRGEVLYLVDGVRISNRLYNTTPPLDTVPSHMVQRIELLEGGQSVFYGTGAVAGVVNIVTRDFSPEPEMRLEAGANTNDGFHLSGIASSSAGAQSAVIFASHDEARGFQPFPDADYEPSATDRRRGYRLTSFGVKYALQAAETVRMSASYTHTTGFVDFARPVQAARAINSRNEEIAWAKLDWDLSERAGLFVKGYWHDWDSHYDETDNSPAGPAVVDDHEFWGFHDYGLNAMGRLVPRPGLEVWGGYDLQRYGGRDDVLLIAQRSETAQAVFGQVRVGPELIPRGHLAAGVRHSFTKVGGDATVWNLSGTYDLGSSVFVRTSVGTAFRLPDAESLFAIDPINNGEVGNPNLKPERSRTLNASIGGQMRGLNWELIGFARATRDLIDLAGPTPDLDVLTFINLPDKVTVRGFEATLSADPALWLTLSASFTHARTRQTGSTLQLAGVPRDHAQAHVDIHPAGENYGFGAALIYMGDVVDQVPSGFGRQARGDYAVVDLTAWARLGASGRLTARLENALGEDYATRVGRASRDASGARYLVHSRGVPRTLHVSYALDF
jgi:vitamin B12 transporter